jgi:demethylmenaquinone methyltransferase/2-methoxy-6-polyprenyl-1,4-benzoquinol methylase
MKSNTSGTSGRESRKSGTEGATAGTKLTHFGFQMVPEEEKVEWVRRHFNSVAPVYDFMNTLLSFGIHYAWKRTAVRMLGLTAGERVLDVCGGTGDLALLAARRVGSRGRVLLYDINEAMIREGRRKRERDKDPERGWIRYTLGNAEKIACPDHCFDAAMVGFGIRNVTRMDHGFAEMCRVLKPGGRMICLEFSQPTMPVFRWLYDVYSFHIMPWLGEMIAGNRQAYTHLPETIRLFPLPDALSEILKDAGFRRVTYRRLTNGIAVVHLAEKG